MRAAPPARTLAVLGLLLAGCWSAAAPADVIRLKNGATIHADSWEERGDDLVIRQGQGTIVVPRRDVEQIVRQAAAGDDRAKAPAGRTPPSAGAAPAAGASGSANEGTAPQAARREGALPAGDIPKEEAERRLAELRRRLADVPAAARAASARALVALLNRLGRQSYEKRDFDDARSRFEEALEHDPHDVSAQFGLAASYLSQGQPIYARSTLLRALVDHPEDPDLLALLGEVYYGEERTEEALAAWRKSFAIKPQGALKERIEKVVRELSIDQGYRRSEAAHFTLRYDGERAGADLEREISDYLEGSFSDFVREFNYYPRQSIVVLLYPAQQFYDATQVEQNVGGLYDGKIRVPCGGLKQLDRESRQVLRHELAHAFIAGKSGGTAPRWLHEGLAQVLEGRTTPPATAAALAKEFQGAAESGSDWGTGFSYPSSLAFVEYLEETLGRPRLVDVLGAMSGGASIEAAFESATRYSLAELRRAWGEDLVRKHLR